MVKMTSVEAQNRFGQLIDTAQREPVAITRHGRTAAFVVSPQDMEEILRERERRSKAVAAYDAWRAKADKHLMPAAAELTDEEVNRLVHELL
jgi:prevent-host-death family protein